MTNNETEIVKTLIANAEKVVHGEVSVTLKRHSGRTVGISHTTCEVVNERSK